MSALILHQEDGSSSLQPSLPPVIKRPNTSEIPFTSGQADLLSAAASRSQRGARGWAGSSWELGQAAGAEHLWSPGAPRSLGQGKQQRGEGSSRLVLWMGLEERCLASARVSWGEMVKNRLGELERAALAAGRGAVALQLAGSSPGNLQDKVPDIVRYQILARP